jgi:hypothetical protein
MSEQDRVESPIDAQLVAPPVSYERAPEANTESLAAKAASKNDQLFDRPWFIIVLMLHVGLLGIPAYWATRYSRRTRVMLVVVSILYTVVAVAIIVWGIMQIVKLF